MVSLFSALVAAELCKYNVNFEVRRNGLAAVAGSSRGF